MYLYIGQETVIPTDDIIGIFDLENTSTSRLTKSYLAAVQQSGQVIEVSTELPKSFIVCAHDGKPAVYLSHISPATLKKRATVLPR